jgi:nicotinamide mononucleotide (NMN) deamidase PncC
MTDESASSAFNAGLVTYTTKERWKSLGRKYGRINDKVIAECAVREAVSHSP